MMDVLCLLHVDYYNTCMVTIWCPTMSFPTISYIPFREPPVFLILHVKSTI